MISAITGQLQKVQDDRVQLACDTVTYEILVPASDIGQLRTTIGQETTFHTIFDLEGDPTRGGLTPRLIGFLHSADKRFFQLFITVKGIGPKRALRALVQPTARIARAIESKDTHFLMELPEIGRRTAEQIVAELAGKLAELAIPGPTQATVASTSHTIGESEAIDAAVQLGIARAEAERLLDRARQADPDNSLPASLLRDMLRFRGARA
jgi:holliday junction DNA helicase RuvA